MNTSSRAAGFLNFLTGFLLTLLLLVSPLAFASEDPVTLFINHALIYAAVLVFLCKQIFVERKIIWIQASVWIGTLGLTLLILAQVLLYSGAFAGFKPGIYWYATAGSFLRGAPLVLLFWVVLNSISAEQQISRMVQWMTVVAFALSLTGIVQSLAGTDKVLGLYGFPFQEPPFAAAFSTFLNENDYAAFVGMLFFLMLGRFVYLLKKYGSLRGRKKEEKYFLLFSLIITSAGLFVSLARGSMIVLLPLVAVFYLLIFNPRDKKQLYWLLGGIVILIFLMVLWIGIEPIVRELTTLRQVDKDVSLQQRFIVWKAVWREIVPYYPLWGTGAGTFFHVFLAIQPEELGLGFQHAHNEWIHILAETGFAGLLCALSVVFCIFKETWKLRGNHTDIYIRYYGSGLLVAFLYMFLMTLYNFPLRNTACAVYVVFFTAFAFKLREFDGLYQNINRRRVLFLSHAWQRILAGVLSGLLLTGLVIPTAVNFTSFYFLWKSGKKSLPHLEKAIYFNPWNAAPYYWAGAEKGERAFYGRDQYNSEKMKEALAFIDKAIALNPSSGEYHYGKARLYWRMGKVNKTDAEFKTALLKEPQNTYIGFYYAIFCLNQASKEAMARGKEMTETVWFTKGKNAYLKVKALRPQAALSDFQFLLVDFEGLKHIFYEQGIIPKNIRF